MSLTELITMLAGFATIGSLLIAGQLGQARRIDDLGKQIDVRFERVDERLERVEVRLDQLAARLERVEVRLDQLAARLERVEVRLDQVEVRLDRIDARLDGVDTRLDRGDERYVQIDDRFGWLEARFTEQIVSTRAELLQQITRVDDRLYALTAHLIPGYGARHPRGNGAPSNPVTS
ncbi:hypothetical protein [Leucobacter luti]|uniref:Uncharacterized protein n=1 Tax=Leucobacter luti TaxID=340320 RepID=A0A4Q7TQ28_9MICO|nr:hypothetical protein [Leucobacter luti]MBL3699815.1 hypothetical protein [Leucobacter luti]RZT62866.1 hypothetical protein EV139_2572 [Leucobacter luti]